MSFWDLLQCQWKSDRLKSPLCTPRSFHPRPLLIWWLGLWQWGRQTEQLSSSLISWLKWQVGIFLPDAWINAIGSDPHAKKGGTLPQWERGAKVSPLWVGQMDLVSIIISLGEELYGTQLWNSLPGGTPPLSWPLGKGSRRFCFILHLCALLSFPCLYTCTWL